MEVSVSAGSEYSGGVRADARPTWSQLAQREARDAAVKRSSLPSRWVKLSWFSDALPFGGEGRWHRDACFCCAVPARSEPPLLLGQSAQ